MDRLGTWPYGIIVSARTIHNFPRKDKIKLFEKIYDKLQEGGIMIMMDKIYPEDAGTCFHLLRLQNARYEYLDIKVKKAIIAHEMQDFNKDYRMQEIQTKEILEHI